MSEIEMCSECQQHPAAVNVNLGIFVAGRTYAHVRVCLRCARDLVERSAYGAIESPCATNGAYYEGTRESGRFVDRDGLSMEVRHVLDFPLGPGSNYRRQGYLPLPIKFMEMV